MNGFDEKGTVGPLGCGHRCMVVHLPTCKALASPSGLQKEMRGGKGCRRGKGEGMWVGIYILKGRCGKLYNCGIIRQ